MMMHIERYADGTGQMYLNGHAFPLRAGQAEPDEVAHCKYCHVSYAGTGPTCSDPCPGPVPRRGEQDVCNTCPDFAELHHCPLTCKVLRRTWAAQAADAVQEAMGKKKTGLHAQLEEARARADRAEARADDLEAVLRYVRIPEE